MTSLAPIRPNIRAAATAAFAGISCLLIAGDKALAPILKIGAVGVIALATYAMFSEGTSV